MNLISSCPGMTFLSQLDPSSQNEGTLRGEMNRQQAKNAFPEQELINNDSGLKGRKYHSTNSNKKSTLRLLAPKAMEFTEDTTHICLGLSGCFEYRNQVFCHFDSQRFHV